MQPTVQITTTIDSEQAAEQIATALVGRRLAACVQIVGPVRSTFRWEGKIEISPEWMCIIKTAADRADDVQSAIRELHGYDVPEILVTPVTGGNRGYLDWVHSETRAADSQ
ncbi:MAG: divalent-cation tolerance protein CutA [Pirellulales bacterium]